MHTDFIYQLLDDHQRDFELLEDKAFSFCMNCEREIEEGDEFCDEDCKIADHLHNNN
jgi:hypothetical protein